MPGLGAGRHLRTLRPHHSGLPRLPPRTRGPDSGPASPGRPRYPARLCKPRSRPTSRGLVTPAPSAFPGHVARAPAGVPRAPPGGGGGGAYAPDGRTAAPRGVCGGDRVHATHRFRSQTHTHLRGNLEGFWLLFIALDTRSSDPLSIPDPGPHAEAATRLAGPASFQALRQ